MPMKKGSNSNFLLNTDQISYNLIVHGGLLLSIFLVLFNNSFYPIESFIFPYLLAQYLTPWISNSYPFICPNTVVLSAVMMSSLLFLNDPSIKDSEKTLVVSFHNKQARVGVLIFYLLVLVVHVQSKNSCRKNLISSSIQSIITGGIIGYIGFSMCSTREKRGDIIWTVGRILISLVILFLLVSYVLGMVSFKK